MIDIAIIASLPHLQDVAALGTIDMALTHLVLAHPAYARHYRTRADAGVRVYLDNSAFELRNGLNAESVLTAADHVNAEVVVCTDVPFDGPATVAATRAFLAYAKTRNHAISQFMAVPQGTTRSEWLSCHDQLIDLPGISMIGLSKLSVPRCFAAPTAEARLSCAAELARRGSPHPFHLLGGDRSLPWELNEHRARGHTLVHSNDSSFAYWYSACDIPLDPRAGRAEREAPGPPELLTTTLTQHQLRTARDNARAVTLAAGLSR